MSKEVDDNKKGATETDTGEAAKKSRRKPAIDVTRGALPVNFGFISRFLLTLFGAASVVLSFARFDIWPLANFAFVALLLAIHDRTPRQAFGWGALFGFISQMGGFYWISTLLMDFAHMSPLIAWAICALMCFAQGLVFALPAWLVRRVQVSQLDLPMWAIAIPAFLAFDFAYPLLFPFYIGTLNYQVIPLIQVAELGGVLAISLLVMCANLIIYHLIAGWLRRRAGEPAALPRGFLIGAIGLYVASLAFGVFRMGQIDYVMEHAEKMRIGLVEGNIGSGDKGDPQKLDNNILTHQNLSAQLESDAELDLLVWPETSYQSTHIWGSTARTDDLVFLELDSLFVPEVRDGLLPAVRALEAGFGRRLDHLPVMHRTFHRSVARAAMKNGYAQVSEVDLMGGIRYGTGRMTRRPYPYRCGEQANMHLKCPFFWVPPDDVTYLLPGRESLQGDVRADEQARTFVWNQRAVRRGFDAPLIYGALTVRAKKGTTVPYHELLRASRRERDLFNVALTVDEDGRVIGNYKKVYLLMFGETIPFGETFPQLYDMIPEAGSFTAGTEAAVVEVNGVRVGMMICYEDILPAFSRKLAQLEPQVLINVTNDSWFGKTAEPYQHLALSTIRAVETRTWLIRSTNTGVSAFVDANGRLVGQTSLDDAEVIARDVPIMSGNKTLYTRIGDILGWLALGAALIMLVLGWRPVRREA